MESGHKAGRKLIASWKRHLQEEVDAAFLYKALAQLETAADQKDILLRLASVEDRHVQLLKKLLDENNAGAIIPRPGARSRILAWIARRFNRSFVYSLMIREEGREVKGYLNLFRTSPDGSSKKVTRTLARESIQHTEALKKLTHSSGEPWHQTSSGGFLRNVVYGFNDGLTANFGLVAGVIGAAVESHIILLSGIAGMVADALSMGSSGYLAAKSEEEVYAHEIAMEKEEIQLMPELEEEELTILYEAKGIEPDSARRMAHEIMSDPQRALEEKAREELGIGESYTTPLKEGLITGTATAIGAFIPVAPFLFLSGTAAILASFIVAMISHFVVGAARNVFTGRGVFRSGFDMFVVGLGVAVAGYFVGDLIVRLFR